MIRKIKKSEKLEGIGVFQTPLLAKGSAICLPGIGIFLSDAIPESLHKPVIQHEFGHYLDYLHGFKGDRKRFLGSGFLGFYLKIGLPSLFNLIPGINRLPWFRGPHRIFQLDFLIKLNKKMQTHKTRRSFIKKIALGSLALGGVGTSAFSFSKPIKIGLISDLHQDIIPDGMERLQAFLSFMKKRRADAIVQMGDFAVPSEGNQPLISLFNTSHHKALHVLGNHDIDYGHTWEQCLKAYVMQSPYYSLELAGIKLLVLDGNENGSPQPRGSYPSYVGKLQQEWIRGELEKAEVPVLILSHQPIAGIYTLDNALEMQDLLAGFADKILLAINGHAHVDQYLEVKGVKYLHLNSASYYWVGEKLAHKSFPDKVHGKHPELAFTCPYSESLFALLSIDLQQGQITLEGRKAEWIGPSPLELGYTILSEDEQRRHVLPELSSRKIFWK
jgi:3',5'-cyclic-AMP phosphodiesterase